MWQQGVMIYVLRQATLTAFEMPLKPGGWKDRKSIEPSDATRGRELRGETKRQMLVSLGVE